MRIIPTSLGARLLAAAALFVAIAILAAALVIAGILGHFVRVQLDGRLDLQIAAVADALHVSGGRLGLGEASSALNGAPFDRPGRGWYWQASAGQSVLASPFLGNARLAFTGRSPPWSLASLLRPWPAEIEGPRGERLLARVSDRFVGDRPVRIIVTAPPQAFANPLRDALVPVVVALLCLGAGLLLALLLQVRLGLRPLGRLRAAVAAVRAGQAARLPTGGQPVEVAPLVAEINSLLEGNAAGIERARRHAANLAHGLKTPLATLSVVLAEPGRDPDGALSSLVAAMDRLIRHHLARARSAALGEPARHRTDLVPRLRDLGDAMTRLHADRRVALAVEAPPRLLVFCEAQDCDELFGNLLDNAFRHARAQVRMRVEIREGAAEVCIEDDGPGLPVDRHSDALNPGRRLDESTPGYGFGLPIAREIAELHGGSLRLGAGQRLGGLCAAVRLPLVPGE